MITKNKLKASICIIMSILTLCGCTKNIDTYLHSIYFENNISTQVPVELISSSDTMTTDLAKLVSPAVVAISATSGNYTSIGSGVSVKSGGYVLTNYHVVEDADDITLYMFNNETSSAIVLWQDEDMDIAVLKSSQAIPYLPMGNNEETQVGQDVIAIGTPLSLNYNHSVTKGIVSAVNRTITVTTTSGETVMQNLIQHDASINRGNSGGPLIDFNGYVVGINTLKISTAEGLGFAIPIDTVSSVVDNVYQNYNYLTPFVGVYGYDVSIMSNYGDGLNAQSGYYVDTVAQGSPAHAAGIKSGDIIVKINDNATDNTVQFRKYLYKNKINDTIKIKIKREDKELETSLKLSLSKEQFDKGYSVY